MNAPGVRGSCAMQSLMGMRCPADHAHQNACVLELSRLTQSKRSNPESSILTAPLFCCQGPPSYQPRLFEVDS
jgi:hypothetical protein